MKIAALLISIFLISHAWAQAEHEFPADYKTAAAGLAQISLDCPYGMFRIEPSLDDDISVRVLRIAHHHDKAKAEKIANECKVSFRKDGTTLVIEVDLRSARRHIRDIFGGLVSGDFANDLEILVKISTPAGLAVKVNTASGDILAGGLHNDLSVEGASSDIKIEDFVGRGDFRLASGDLYASAVTGDLHLSGASSDFQIEDMKGNLEIICASGDGIVRRVTGQAKLETTSGDLKVFEVDGDLDLETASGDIMAEELDGSVKARSSSGDIRLLGLTDPGASFDILTTSGDALIEVTSGFDGQIEVETSSGDISSDIELTVDNFNDSYLSGRVGSGSGRIRIITTSGDIKISRL